MTDSKKHIIVDDENKEVLLKIIDDSSAERVAIEKEQIESGNSPTYEDVIKVHSELFGEFFSD